jgi:hypothetical protein
MLHAITCTHDGEYVKLVDGTQPATRMFTINACVEIVPVGHKTKSRTHLSKLSCSLQTRPRYLRAYRLKLDSGPTMWEDMGSVVSSALAVPADAAFRTVLSLIVVYCCTALPVVLWAVRKTFQQPKVCSPGPYHRLGVALSTDLLTPSLHRRPAAARQSRQHSSQAARQAASCPARSRLLRSLAHAVPFFPKTSRARALTGDQGIRPLCMPLHPAHISGPRALGLCQSMHTAYVCPLFGACMHWRAPSTASRNAASRVLQHAEECEAGHAWQGYRGGLAGSCQLGAHAWPDGALALCGHGAAGAGGLHGPHPAGQLLPSSSVRPGLLSLLHAALETACRMGKQRPPQDNFDAGGYVPRCSMHGRLFIAPSDASK